MHFQNGRQNNDAKEHGQKESPLTKSLPHNLVSRPHFLSDFPGFWPGRKSKRELDYLMPGGNSACDIFFV